MAKDLHIYIPSYRRAEKTTRLTLRWLSPEWQERTTMVVDKKDHEDYRRTWWNLGKEQEAMFNRVKWDVVSGKTAESIAQKRAHIMTTTKHSKILMFDDDLEFCARAADGTLPRTDRVTVDKYLKDLEKILDKYVHAGFGPRQNNNSRGAGWQPIGRMMYALGYNMDVIRKKKLLEYGRIETREDFDYTLQLLKQGYPNVLMHELCVGQTFNSKGGNSLCRTMDASNADADKLAELHPGLVNVVFKDYGTVEKRKEVIVGWKKAYESSPKVQKV